MGDEYEPKARAKSPIRLFWKGRPYPKTRIRIK